MLFKKITYQGIMNYGRKKLSKSKETSIQRTMEKKGLFIKFEELTTMAQTLIFPYSFSIFFHYPFSLTCNLYVDRKSRTLTTKGNGKLHG